MSSNRAGSSDDLRTAPFSLSSVLSPIALLRARRYVDLMSSPRLLDSPTATATPARMSSSSSSLTTPAPDVELNEFVEVMNALRRAAEAHAIAQKNKATEAAETGGTPPPTAEDTVTLSSSRTSEGARLAPVLSPIQSSPSDAFSPLRALREVFGDTKGSALHRTWLETPQAHLARLTKRLSQAVLMQYVRHVYPIPPSAAPPHATTPNVASSTQVASSELEAEAQRVSRAFEVHVQWLPSHSTALDTVRDAAEVAAVVTVRRREALARLAAEEARLAARYLSVAAPGQTVESSLRFWRDVTTGDCPRGEEAAFDPVGFDAASRLAQERLSTTTTAAAEEGDEAEDEATRGPARAAAGTSAAGRKRGRDGATTSAATAPVVVLGATTTATANTPTSVSSSSSWRQPSVLVAPAPLLEDKVGKPLRGLSGPHARHAPRRIRHSHIGLVAVLYVTVHGVAYVGFAEETTPSATGRRDEGGPHMASPPPARTPTPASAPPPPTPTEPASRILLTQALLPLESDDSFTRGLLRL